MGRKTFRAPMELKSDQKGSFEAVFATLQVVDKDGDWTARGAFGEQLVSVEGWNHDMSLPVGKGRIFERGDEAICKGQFFMDTTAGRDHYQVVKNLGPQTEWSYTFQILKSEPGRGPEKRRLLDLEVHGVSPVTRGAGEGTRTVRISKRYGSDNLALIEGWENWISRDPKRARVQIGYFGAGEMGVASVTEVPSDPAEARKAIALEFGDAGELKELIADELFAADVEKLEAAVKQGSDHPTNFDVLRTQVRRAFGDVSEAYVTEMARVRLADMALQLQRNDNTLNPHAAWQQVRAWAARPA